MLPIIEACSTSVEVGTLRLSCVIVPIDEVEANMTRNPVAFTPKYLYSSWAVNGLKLLIAVSCAEPEAIIFLSPSIIP